MGLFEYFKSNNRRIIHKYVHYFGIYERYFLPYKAKPIVFLEIGIQNGGSYQMWRNYFGDNALFIGIDIDERCKQFEEENFRVFIGSQSDRQFLQSVISQIPPVDIILDDGGHTMEQQIVSFEELFPHVKNGGLYMVEDTQTSYYLQYGGGYLRKGSFVEFAKKFADVVHGFVFNTKNKMIEKYKNSVESVHFYSNIVIFFKNEMSEPFTQKTGVEEIAFVTEEPKILDKITYKLFLIVNSILAFFKLPSTKIKDNPFR